jgi:hypothetical protein
MPLEICCRKRKESGRPDGRHKRRPVTAYVLWVISDLAEPYAAFRAECCFMGTTVAVSAKRHTVVT